MTIDAAQRLAVHAAGKMIRRHEQRARRTVGARRRKSRHAVTAEAGRVGEILGALGDCALHPNEDGR
jgi:predicted lysophospholipase L1 biosynthesis ABC-type transport system permease subunit